MRSVLSRIGAAVEWRNALATVSGVTFMVLRFLLPRRRCIVVAGMTPEEGNASEMVRALAARYDGPIYWICPPSPDTMATLGLAGNPRIIPVLNRWRLPVIVAYLTAELVVTTHGLYGMPATPRRKVVLDVWHGEQAKGGGRLYPARRLPGKPASYLLVASDLLADEKLSRAGLKRRHMLWSPNPRVDQLGRPATDSMLSSLGIDPTRPFVVWMPTFRQGKDSEKDPAWVNTTNPDLDRQLDTLLETLLVEVLEDADVQLVVKPHMLDLLARSVQGARVILSEQLDAAGVPLYSLLGRSSGLITDYSSVWIDYLSGDRPIAFYMPDRTAYEGGRGALPTGAYDQLPGPVIESEEDVRRFVRDVLRQGADSAADRQAAREHLRLRSTVNAADLIVDWIADRSSVQLLPADS